MRENSAMWVALLIVCFAGGTSPLPSQTAKLYVSSKAGDRITAKPDVQFSGAKAGGVRVMAFQTPECIVAQILNSTAENKGVNLEFRGKSLHVTAPAISIATVTW
jgi:Glycosyl hydrolase family 30 beta sandwich domain